MDKYSGQNYEHRRGWVEDRLLFLAGIFAIDSAATVFVLTTRMRLYDISWLMRDLNEYIAREANKEDKCTGRFYSLPSMALTLRAS